MINSAALPTVQTMEQVLIEGDLSRLSEEHRLLYYNKVCQSLGLNQYTKPFDFLRLSGKLVLYAKRDCTDQLRKLHRVSVKIVSRERLEDVYVVTAQATTPDGRTDESVGAVPIHNLKGDMLANALMKAETKAKRRVTLSICGLGVLDETEIETIPGVSRDTAPTEPPQVSAGEPGDYIVPIGKKYKGKRLKDVPAQDLFTFCQWLENRASETGEPLSAHAQEFIETASKYFATLDKDNDEN